MWCNMRRLWGEKEEHKIKIAPPSTDFVEWLICHWQLSHFSICGYFFELVKCSEYFPLAYNKTNKTQIWPRFSLIRLFYAILLLYASHTHTHTLHTRDTNTRTNRLVSFSLLFLANSANIWTNLSSITHPKWIDYEVLAHNRCFDAMEMYSGPTEIEEAANIYEKIRSLSAANLFVFSAAMKTVYCEQMNAYKHRLRSHSMHVSSTHTHTHSD